MKVRASRSINLHFNFFPPTTHLSESQSSSSEKIKIFKNEKKDKFNKPLYTRFSFERSNFRYIFLIIIFYKIHFSDEHDLQHMGGGFGGSKV